MSLMQLLRVIPKIFYVDIRQGLQLFIDTLGFSVGYYEPDPQPFYVIKRDNVTLILSQDAEFALKDRPEIRIAVDDIEALYGEVTARNPRMLHPNSPLIKTQPWGLREFALRDDSDVCVIIQQDVHA